MLGKNFFKTCSQKANNPVCIQVINASVHYLGHIYNMIFLSTYFQECLHLSLQNEDCDMLFFGCCRVSCKAV